MIRVIPTLDYEIHGNGQGCPAKLMVIPTRKILDLFDRYEAKLTIMADVAEILRFRAYYLTHGRDRFHYQAIENQLKEAVQRGHDVQLHLHSSYFNAVYRKGHWQQDWSEYDFARLDYERMRWMIQTGKNYLETLLKPVDEGYQCIAFRAVNWSMQPSASAIAALLDNGIRMDSSVYKFGKRNYPVTYDYSKADSHFLPWPVASDDICRRKETGQLIEVPIYSEQRNITAFASLSRGYRVLMSLCNQIPDTPAKKRARTCSSQFRAGLSMLQDKHAWKADFNQCSGGQMIAALNRMIPYKQSHPDHVLPFVMIGHSKIYNAWNEISLKGFLDACRRQPETVRFDSFRSIYPELQSRWLEQRL